MCRGQGCDGKAKVQTKMGTSSVVSLATLKVTGLKSQHTKSWSMNFMCSWLLVKFNIIIARHDPARKVVWAFLYWNLEEQVNFSN